MTKKEIVSLSLKLVGIYCLVVALTHLSYAIQSVASLYLQEDLWSVIISARFFVLLLQLLTPFILLLLLGFYLLFSNKLPSKISSSMTREEKTYSFTFQDIQILAFSIIGVWLLSDAVPTFIRLVIQRIAYHRASFQSVSPLRDSINISHIAAAVLKIALGIYLFSGGKGLIRLWQKLDNTRDMKRSGNN